MDEYNMLSGSQLVAKGATKKVEGQLPEVGLKEVTPNGSWLEQKQIQSFLEAQKYLIAVERIEKSGSITHAEWRDNLKLAEVTKQTGGHWQYIGHKRGKYLYLLPEETLFLLETNNLILRHSGVTVSMKKAFRLCLKEIPLIQYKVYASLSRLGYRILRHKENTAIITEAISESVPMDTESPNIVPDSIVNVTEDNTSSGEAQTAENTEPITIVNIAEGNTNNEEAQTAKNTKLDSIEIIAEENKNDNEAQTAKNIESDSIVNIAEENTNDEETQTAKNIELNTIINIDDKIPINDVIVNTERNNETDIVQNLIIKVPETNNTIPENNESSNKNKEALPSIEISTNESENQRMDIDETNRTTVTPNENNVQANEETENVVRESIEEDYLPDSTDIEAPNVTIGAVYSVDISGVIRPVNIDTPVEMDSIETIETIPVDSTNQFDNDSSNTSEAIDICNNNSIKHFQAELMHYENKIKKLNERKSISTKRQRKEFELLQDLYKQDTVKISAPDEKYLPRNVFLDKSEYNLNIDVVRTQNASNVNDDNASISSTSTPTPHQGLRDIRDFPTFGYNTQPRFNFNTQPRFSYQQRPYNNRHFNNRNFRYMHRNMPFYYPRFYPNAFVRHYAFFNAMHGYQNDRRDAIKKYHYDSIVNIAMRVKNGQSIPSQVRALLNLISSFNLRYNTNVTLNPDFTVTDSAEEAEKVIKIDDDEKVKRDEPKRKKQRMNEDKALYNSNFEKLAELATKLKELHEKNIAVSRHRRVFSNAIKTFNRSFNTDIDLDPNFKLIDRKTVVLDTSSDSDTVIVEKEKPKRTKRLRNPYSILKQLSKDVNLGASTSVQVPVIKLNMNASNNTSQRADRAIIENDRNMEMLKSFHESRFPESDFSGRETCSLMSAHLDEPFFLTDCLDYLKDSAVEFESWVDVKLAVLKDIRGSLNLEKQQVEALSNDFFMAESQLQPILGPDCTDLKTALKRLAIIPTNKEVLSETSLRIHFDVCNRDVHFKKSNPPKPNFRVVCYKETDAFPSTEDIVALQSKYKDDVPIVFAFVGTSASISYLQIKSTELPVFIPESDASEY